MERWRDIIGYVGIYQVSDLGRVRSLDRVVVDKRGGRRTLKGRILRLSPKGQYGYVGVDLSKNGVCTSVMVQHLVTAAWIGPCPDGQWIQHDDNDPTNNRHKNLWYGTPLDVRIASNADNGRRVRRSDGVEYRSMADANRQTGSSKQSIWAACNGRAKTAGGYKWAYIDD